MYTPTLLFLDEEGRTALRVNGYYPPHKFEAALDYVAGRLERKQTFRDYLASAEPTPASGVLHQSAGYLPSRSTCIGQVNRRTSYCWC